MKRILQLMAMLILLVAGATWLATGANPGWTQTSVVVKTLDPVTEIVFFVVRTLQSESIDGSSCLAHRNRGTKTSPGRPAVSASHRS